MRSRPPTSYPLLLLLLLALSPPLIAAESPGKATDQAAVTSSTRGDASVPAKQSPHTLLELILAGGPVNIGFISVLALFSLVGLAVILERLVNLTTGKLIPPGFVSGLQELVRRQEYRTQPFRELCDRYPSVISNILKAGLLRAGRPVPEVEKAMEDAAAREMGVLRSKVRPLTVLSSVGPLVGLLGTAIGMILVFQNLSQATLVKAEVLAEGIYLKLETTVAGLIVAIPSVVFAALFNGRNEKLLRRIDEHLMETIPCFVRMEQKDERPLARSSW